ncbi:MAG TPA: DUF1579 family protein [Longimicrobiaceae bacterium]|nr:DUF1579 family protein [Longimicrobiaceae bacterium]
MGVLDGLAACAGSWRGTNTLHDPHSGQAQESPGTATVTPVLGGRFVRVEYTWEYQGTPQEGSLLIGYDPGVGELHAHWVDTWHMGHAGFPCRGPAPGGPTLAVRGSYPAPPGPDWGWRIELTPDGGEALRMAMVNIWPEGREDPAVEATYTRA